MSGTWGDTVNNGITSLIETSLAGYTSIAMTDANYTLSQANGAADEARSMMINMTGTLTANRNVVCPNVNKMYVFRNSTTGGFSLVLKTSGGTGVTVPAGKTITVFCDGADNIFDATSYFSGAITVNGAFTTNSTITGGATTTTGVFSAPLGSVGAPSYTFTGDTNTGAWSPGADTLAWSTGGSERMRIDSSGNVGIGQSPATRKLEANVIPASANQLNGLRLQMSGVATAMTELLLGSDGGGVPYTSLRTGPDGNGFMTFYTGSTPSERMRIDASGNVGIGAAPATRLHAFGASAVARIESSGDQYTQLQIKHATRQWAVVSGPSSDPYFYLEDTTGGRRVLQADFSGNVGIGAAPASGKLDVYQTAGLSRLSVKSDSAQSAAVSIAGNGTTPGTTAFDLFNDSAAASIYQRANLPMLFGTNNTERMRIDASGNVGIGITPSTKVDINVAGGMLRIGSGSGNNQLQAYSSGGTLGLWAGGSSQVYSNGGLSFLVGATTGTGVPSGGTTAVTIDSSGNVGINGAANGAVQLHVNPAGGLNRAAIHVGDLATGLSLWQSTGNDPAIIYGSASALRFGTQTGIGAAGFVERMRIDGSGRVGIGKTPTTYALEINGDAQATNFRGAVIGNADTATILQTARTINGVSFNGSANITVAAAAGTLTGATLASGVTGSSLTSVASGCTDGTNELGYKDIPRTTGGLTRGQAYATAAGFTVNTGSAAGSAYSVYNDSAAAFTITQGSGLTLRQGGTTNTGNRTLAARGFATIWFNSTTEAVISGSGLT